jgi:hypothetical protein
MGNALVRCSFENEDEHDNEKDMWKTKCYRIPLQPAIRAVTESGSFSMELPPNRATLTRSAVRQVPVWRF